MKTISWFISVCSQNNLVIGGEQAALFEEYRKLLLYWNAQINLISRKDEDNFYSHHVLNCVSFLFNRGLKLDARILDLGTGGGLPGIPVKIICPGLRVTLLDSIEKKTTALSDIVKHLRLENVEVVTGRAERLAQSDEFKGSFDYVITRAAGRLDEVTKWSRDLLRKPEVLGGDMIPIGSLIVLKGGKFDDELRLARRAKFVKSIEVKDIVFKGMEEIENREKKLVLVQYR
jgi:16S rRNA (guanine527-N7)-methyltransferase